MDDREIDIIVGENLRHLREYCELSLEYVGDRMEVSYQQVQKYEKGANRISASKLYKAGEILNCQVSEFFQGLPDV